MLSEGVYGFFFIFRSDYYIKAKQEYPGQITELPNILWSAAE